MTDTQTPSYSAPTDELRIHVTVPVAQPAPNQLPLTPEQLAAVGLDHPPPIVYDDLTQLNSGKGYGGMCPWYPNYPNLNGGEVILDQGLTSLVLTERKRARRHAHVYLHEVAHRITDESHTPVFAAVCLTLSARHEGTIQSASSHLDLYNLWDTEQALIAEAFAFALSFAQKHHKSEVKARALVPLAREGWKHHLAHDSARAKAQSQLDLYMKQTQELLEVRSAHHQLRLQDIQSARTIEQLQQRLQAQQIKHTERLKQARAQTRTERERNQWLVRGYQLIALLGALTVLASL